jgi:hypothetical protein
LKNTETESKRQAKVFNMKKIFAGQAARNGVLVDEILVAVEGKAKIARGLQQEFQARRRYAPVRVLRYVVGAEGKYAAREFDNPQHQRNNRPEIRFVFV